VKEAVVALASVVGLLALGLLAVFGLLQQMLRQQGRLLHRIESLERAAQSPEAVPEPVQGLPVGTPIPRFQLADAVGRLVGPDDLKGRRALLVHWNTQCGFCDLIADDLAALQSDLDKRGTELVLVSHGDVESNREFAERHGLTCRILHLEGGDPADLFASLGTPVAYLVDEQGRVAEPLAVGANEVPALARRAAEAEPRKLRTQRSLDESRVERDGLRAGSPAPAFELSDLNGDTVALDDFRGQRLLLVFSDPGCGPCNALAPDLARFEREAGDDLAVLMVSRGDAEANRAKAEEHDFEFPVVLQPGWRISKAYGIFATPVAFLVGREGTIERDVARGPQAILELARAAAEPREEVSAGTKR
jgi:peroxiredoxin